MQKQCDNKSVGVLIWNDNNKLLLIERKIYNPGFAIPAGHQDGDDAKTTAHKEVSEEVGLQIEEVQKRLVISLKNPCKRAGGSYHDWTIFEAIQWSGVVNPSEDETKGYRWISRQELQDLARRLEGFAQSEDVPLETDELPRIVQATNERKSWIDSPGLEPPMYFILKDLYIL